MHFCNSVILNQTSFLCKYIIYCCLGERALSERGRQQTQLMLCGSLSLSLVHCIVLEDLSSPKMSPRNNTRTDTIPSQISVVNNVLIFLWTFKWTSTYRLWILSVVSFKLDCRMASNLYSLTDWSCNHPCN